MKYSMSVSKALKVHFEMLYIFYQIYCRFTSLDVFETKKTDEGTYFSRGSDQIEGRESLSISSQVRLGTDSKNRINI